MSVAEDPSAPAVLPARFVVLGRRDALVVLSLRLLRRGTWLLIPLGASLALLTGISEDRLSSDYGTVSDWLHALLSPLWLLTIGILLRLAIAPLAYVVAVVVTLLGPRDVRTTDDRRGRWARRGDTWRVAGGLRALRWTTSARDQAVTMAGGSGALLRRAETVLGWLTVVACVGFVVVLFARAP